MLEPASGCAEGESSKTVDEFTSKSRTSTPALSFAATTVAIHSRRDHAPNWYMYRSATSFTQTSST